MWSNEKTAGCLGYIGELYYPVMFFFRGVRWILLLLAVLLNFFNLLGDGSIPFRNSLALAWIEASLEQTMKYDPLIYPPNRHFSGAIC